MPHAGGFAYELDWSPGSAFSQKARQGPCFLFVLDLSRHLLWVVLTAFPAVRDTLSSFARPPGLVFTPPGLNGPELTLQPGRL